MNKWRVVAVVLLSLYVLTSPVEAQGRGRRSKRARFQRTSTTTSLCTAGPVAQGETRFADRLPGADAGAKINAAVAALPQAGGIVDARGLRGAASAAATITLDRPVVLLLGSLDLDVRATPAIRISSPGGNVEIRGVHGQSVLRNGSNMSSKSAMILADYGATAQASNIVIQDVTLIGGSSAADSYKRGIVFRNVTTSAVRCNDISGIEQPSGGVAVGDAIAIDFNDRVTNSQIENNRISFLAQGDFHDANYRTGIELESPMVDGFNGQVSGATPLPATVSNIEVTGNTVLNGTHGMGTHNVSHARFTRNTAIGQRHRNMIIYVTNDHIEITGNVLRNAGSTNLIADYGNSYLTITGNTIDAATDGMGNNIALMMGNSHVVIRGNRLAGANRHAIVVANKGTDISITENTIVGFSAGPTAYSGVALIAGPGKAWGKVKSGGGLDSINVTGNEIDNTLGGDRSGITVLGRDGDDDSDTPVTNVTIGSNTITGTTYGVHLRKGGNAGAWKVNTGENTLRGVAKGRVADDEEKSPR